MKNWFFSSEVRTSEKNGEIRIQRLLGSWEVRVGNTSQTSSYTNAMWKDVCRKVARLRDPSKVRKALLLGLGGGGAIKAVHNYFPFVTVTAIEHDPVMVDIAREIGLQKPFPFPRVLVRDARDIIPSLRETFDLIIVDIFEGTMLSPALTDAPFLEALSARLSEAGILAVNVSGHRTLIKNIAELFPEGTIWRFRANTLGIFWNTSGRSLKEKIV